MKLWFQSSTKDKEVKKVLSLWVPKYHRTNHVQEKQTDF